MQEFLNVTQIRYNTQAQNAKIGQRTEKIWHLSTKFQFQEWTRHNQFRGSHKLYCYSQYFLKFCMYTKKIKNVINKVKFIDA